MQFSIRYFLLTIFCLLFSQRARFSQSQRACALHSAADRPNYPACQLRSCSLRFAFLFYLTAFCLSTFNCPAYSLTNSELSDNIPPLRPPRTEIPQGFWEKNSLLFAIVTLLALGTLGLALVIIRRHRQLPCVHPASEAREALRLLAAKPEDGSAISLVSRILRRYFTISFGLPEEELTTSEFSAAMRACEPLGQDLANQVAFFFAGCDQKKFAEVTLAGPPWALPEALRLIALGEQRLQFLRQQQASQPSAPDARKS
jgi:hypothetical protein